MQGGEGGNPTKKFQTYSCLSCRSHRAGSPAALCVAWFLLPHVCCGVTALALPAEEEFVLVLYLLVGSLVRANAAVLMLQPCRG